MWSEGRSVSGGSTPSTESSVRTDRRLSERRVFHMQTQLNIRVGDDILQTLELSRVHMMFRVCIGDVLLRRDDQLFL